MDGPTLEPPTLSKPAQLDEALALEADDDAVDAIADGEPEATVEPDRPTAPAEPATPPAEPEPEPEPEPPTSTFVALANDGDAEPLATSAGSPIPAAASAAAELSGSPEAEARPAGPDDERVATPEPPADSTSVRDRLSLTGRIASLRRRGAPAAEEHQTGSRDPDESTPAEPPPVTSVTAVSASAKAVDRAPAGPVEVPPPAKPSFSERAALRRRAKTLRARRDIGLLELGAIVLDQRRFGDPTAGALLRRRTDELGDLDNEIAEIEHALDDHASAAAVAALGEIRCVGCTSLVGPSDRYCSHCGTPRPVHNASATDGSADQSS